MAETPTLETTVRTETRRRRVARLRKQGMLPGIIYGHKQEPVCVSVNAEELERIIRHGDRVIYLNTNGSTETVQIKDLQWDYLGKEMIHVDFKRVSKDEKVEIAVAIEIRGTAPGTMHGGVFEHPLPVLNIECLATNTPTSIVVNVNQLEIEQQILVKDLKLPEGVVALDDPDTLVAQVITKVDEEDLEGEEREQAEPELIGREDEPKEEDS